MLTRRKFITRSSAAAAASILLPPLPVMPSWKVEYGVQLYTFRDSMLKDPQGTLEEISKIGIKKIESARSKKGLYYGLSPEEMDANCKALGMQLVSGHVALDDDFQNTMEQAVASGQAYLICSSMPSDGQHIDNYKKVAEQFNKAGEACKRMGLKFGYHNHEYEFETHNGKILYDILMDETDPELVHMELDLGWVIVAGKDPMAYFEKYPGRFPLWHLKDMDMKKKESTEFGKGGLDIVAMMQHRKKSGVQHIFIEQEEYARSPARSMRDNMTFLDNMNL